MKTSKNKIIKEMGRNRFFFFQSKTESGPVQSRDEWKIKKNKSTEGEKDR